MLPGLDRLSLGAAPTGVFAAIPLPPPPEPDPDDPEPDPDAPAAPPPPSMACPVSMEDLPYGDATRTFRVAYTNPDGAVVYNWFDGRTLARHVHECIRQGRAPFNPCNNVALDQIDIDQLLAAHPAGQFYSDATQQLVQGIVDRDSVAIRAALVRGADVFATPSGDHVTAMHVAALMDRPDLMRELVRRGFLLPNSQDNRGNTPLHYATRTSATAAVEQLLWYHPASDPMIRNRSDGYTALHVAARSDLYTIIDHIVRSAGRMIVDVPSNGGNTALHLAAANNGTEAVRRLLAHGANVNATNVLQETALHIAALQAYSTTLQALLDAPGVDVNARERLENTPLHRAVVMRGNEVRAGVMVEMLIDAGADPTAVNSSEQTPADAALRVYEPDSYVVIRLQEALERGRERERDEPERPVRAREDR